MSNDMTAFRQWASRPADERYETMAALTDAVSLRRNISRAEVRPVKKMQAVLEDSTALRFETGDGTLLQPTHWSFGQVANWINAPAKYLRERISDNPALVRDNINHCIKTIDTEQLKVLTLEPEGGQAIMQATTSPTYGRIWDADVAQCANRIVESTGGAFFNPKDWQKRPSGLYASDRDIFIFMIDGGSIVEGPRAELNRGFFMWNSEVGNSSFGICMFLFNQVCGNHIIWGIQEKFELTIRHTASGPTRFDNEALPLLKQYIESSAEPERAAIKKAHDYLIPARNGTKVDKEDLAKFLGRNGKFTNSEVDGCYNRAIAEENECRTLWQAIQGGTAYARGFDWIDKRVETETRFGKLLNLVKN